MSRLPLPCSRCGYDLRGQPASARCPECGLELLDETGAAMMARMRWRNSVRTACDSLVVATAAAILAGLLVAALRLAPLDLAVGAGGLIAFAMVDASILGFAVTAFALAPPGRRLSPLMLGALLSTLAVVLAPFGLCLLPVAPSLIAVPAVARAIMPLLLAIGIVRTNRIIGRPASPRREGAALVSGVVTAAAWMLVLSLASRVDTPAGTLALGAGVLLDCIAHATALAAARPVKARIDSVS